MLSRAPATVRRLAALLLVVGLGLAPLAAIAGFGVDRPLADPALERRALELNKELRCLVCQNQSIADSNAPLARDLRDVVRERVAAGDSDRQVLDYLVARYGDWVLLAPPFKQSTLALWLGPLLLLLVSGVAVRLWLMRQRRRADPASAPLDADARARAQSLLRGGGGA